MSEISVLAEKDKQADGRWSLTVERVDQARAIRYLSVGRLMKVPAQGGASKTSIMSSREEQRFQYERGLSREIENTLTNIPGVLDARVHINLPQIDQLLGRRAEGASGSGSVLLIVGSEGPNKSEIASLLSGASGVPVKAISVLIQRERLEGERASVLRRGQGAGVRALEFSTVSRPYAAVLIAVLLICAGLAFGAWHYVRAHPKDIHVDSNPTELAL